MNTPKVTVLMPVYNAERFLREAIDSILIQTFEDFEFIIIDDGSTDGSKDIVRSYIDPRIRFFENEINLGISETLNKGIKLAACEMIARMDADDVSYPHRLQKQYNYMTQHPNCALLSTWARVVTEDKRFVRLERYRSKFYYYNLTFECWMYHPTIMFRKEPVEAVGMYSMKYSEDYDLFWKLSTAFEIGNLAETLLDYRLSSTSLNTVLKRKEYDIANEQNVLRNIRYYMGEDFTISKNTLECLRHNFTPIATTENVEDVLDTLKILSAITDKILTYNNPNRNEEHIDGAHYFKRNFIIAEVCKLLPRKKAMELLIKTNSWMVLYEWTRHSLQWRFKRLAKVFA
jgi:glycosyltransferase involved in cell wall biosynthesis